MEKEGTLRMSQKERERLKVLELVTSTGLKLRKAAEILGISYRQCKRIFRRYRQEGDRGLLHRSRGKPSNRGKEPALKVEVLKRYRSRYDGFGPTLASEKLEKDGYRVDHETLRRWLLSRGLWARVRIRKAYRSRRERKEHRGELVQMDGSIHPWFGESEERAARMDMVDDSTRDTYAQFHKGETTRAAMLTLWGYIDKNGIPRALYVDRDSIYITDREPTLEEQLRGEQPLTQFGKAVQKLGIKIIPAYSPQAKGRVERKNRVYQDRLVKELRLEGIRTIEGGNRLLQGGFSDDLNRRFGVAPKSDIDLHRPVSDGLDLRRVFCFEEDRVVDNDWTVRWHTRVFQISKKNNILPSARKKVTVQEWLDGSIHIVYRGEEIVCSEIVEKPVMKEEPMLDVSGETTYYRPAKDHPWRRYKNRPRLAASPR